jgi:hypothetical protein
MSIIAISAAVITTAVMPSFEPVTCSRSMVFPLFVGGGLSRQGQVSAEADIGASNSSSSFTSCRRSRSR